MEELDRAIEVDKKGEGKKVLDNDSQLDEDEQLAKALHESLNVKSSPPSSPPQLPPPRSPSPQSPPRQSTPPQPSPFLYPSAYRICAGCNSEIGHGRYLSCMGAVWHPKCFCCHACDLAISDSEFSMSDERPFHKSCYKDLRHPRCDVCKNFIPTNAAGLIEYRAHPFWHQKYCPSHEHDGTPRCCSCERMEPVDAINLVLDNGRKLCLECQDSSIMGTNECQLLYLEIQEFYEGLLMKVEQPVPLLLVEKQALNEAIEVEKTVQSILCRHHSFAKGEKGLIWYYQGHQHMPETRGLCLSGEQTVNMILRRPKIGGYRIKTCFLSLTNSFGNVK